MISTILFIVLFVIVIMAFFVAIQPDPMPRGSVRLVAAGLCIVAFICLLWNLR